MTELLMRPHCFERGDKVYLTTPLTLATPSARAVEEYAFATAVRSQAPNEHIGWLSGRYVEAGRGNLNNAMWLSDELALKSLTPMLMPVTVMHDPRTAVGTIADCKLINGETANSRIDNVLAIWTHRFPEIWEEVEENIENGTLMESMECLSPSYVCSECGQQYLKLAEGKEQASWCEHLRGNSSRRILQDVCFTGTGLIFGTRGGKGAYTEAYLDHFQDEIAEFHDKAHVDGRYKGEPAKMPRVEIESEELSALRQERDSAREEVASIRTDLTTKVEQAEAEATREKQAREQAEARTAELEKEHESAQLKDKRLGELGSAFMEALGPFTRERLAEQAGAQSDEEWDATVKEKEELTGVERAASKEGGPTTGGKDVTPSNGPKKPRKQEKNNPTQGGGGADFGSEEEETSTVFSSEEIASFTHQMGGSVERPTAGGNAARALARSFSPKSKSPAKS